jgi:hypothetical protein
MDNQHEVRPRRHPVALLHSGIWCDALLEGHCCLVALPVQRDFDDRRQAVPDMLRNAVRIQQRHLPLDQPRRAGASRASGRSLQKCEPSGQAPGCLPKHRTATG